MENSFHSLKSFHQLSTLCQALSRCQEDCSEPSDRNVFSWSLHSSKQITKTWSLSEGFFKKLQQSRLFLKFRIPKKIFVFELAWSLGSSFNLTLIVPRAGRHAHSDGCTLSTAQERGKAEELEMAVIVPTTKQALQCHNWTSQIFNLLVAQWRR